MALFVFLAASAGAGIVAAHFLLDVHRHRFLLVLLSCLRRRLHARSLQFVHVHLGAFLTLTLYGFGGWTRKENVALCPGRADWLDRMEAEDFLVVTGRELRLPQEPYSPQTSALSLPMGTKLPLVKAADAPQTVNRRKSYGCYVVKLPVRGDGGAIADEYALIPVSENVSRGYLPYTRENELRLAFELLGDRYGWAGMYGANDCSGIIHEIFACFGFCLPRTAEAIMAIQGFGGTELQDKTDAQKLRSLAGM